MDPVIREGNPSLSTPEKDRFSYCIRVDIESRSSVVILTPHLPLNRDYVVN